MRALLRDTEAINAVLKGELEAVRNSSRAADADAVEADDVEGRGSATVATSATSAASAASATSATVAASATSAAAATTAADSRAHLLQG